MTLRTSLAACAAVFVLAPTFASDVSAQALPRCFGGDAVASAPLTLGARVRIDSACEFALDPSGPWRRLSGKDTVVDLLAGLQWSDARQGTVYGRRPDAPTEVASVFVDHCTDYVLQPGGPFAVRPGSEAGSLVVERVAAHAEQCGASAIALELRCEGSGATAMTLGVRDRSLTLPACQAGWRVDARASGEPTYPLGRLTPGGETPLQRRLRDGAALMRPDWSGERGLRFSSVERDADAWAELRTAFGAGAARLVRRRGVSSRAACEVGGQAEGEPVPVVVTSEALSFDEAWIARTMRDRYGADGERFVPSLAMLAELAGELHLCLAGTYGARGLREAIGLAFAQTASASELTTRFVDAEVCVTDVVHDVTPSGLRPREGARRCVTTADAPLLATTVGAVLELPEGTLACSGSDEVEVSEGRVTLARGLVEVRVATRGGCQTFETAALARIGVLDPGLDWVPAGISRRDHDAPADVRAWRGVPVDDPSTFAYVRRRDELRFRLTTPEGLAAAWNHPARSQSDQGAATSIGQHAPGVGVEQGRFGHARPSAFVTRLTNDAECPVGRDARFVVASEVVLDGVVHAHLVHDDGQTKRCVAHAAFRSREPRTVATVGNSERRQLRVGFLGDARLGVFFSAPEPNAIGALLPIFYTDLHLKAGFVFEISVPLTASVAWSDGRASRIGPALMVAMNWGYPEIAPRLLTFGFLVHPPWPHPDDRVWSFFGGVNLTSLIDLLGGR